MTDPTALDVISTLGPLATTLAALVALVVGLVTWRQRSAADRRDQWWRRTQWALDQALSADPARRVAGLDVLALQAGSELAGTEELRLLRRVTVPTLDEPGETAFSASDEAPAVPGSVAAAARLRVVVDRRLGLASPGWVEDAAERDGLPPGP